MWRPYTFAVADDDFYAPLETAEHLGEIFRPQRMPEGWEDIRLGVWTMWRPQNVPLPETGWKVHVSARPDRLSAVLDKAAGVCADQGVAFKHLSSRLFYTWSHHKHAARSQCGKFIAAYPCDAEASRRLMEALREALRHEEGPYVLTDRRYRDSRTVHYRYGAYRRVERLLPDGTRRPLVRNGHGELQEDERGVSFRPPAGITDPFAPDRPVPVSASGSTAFEGFVFEKVLRHSNSGGAYQGRQEATGRRVFIKEARPHTGVGPDGRDAVARLRAERETLHTLHTVAPGLAPEPLGYFRRWEHEFLVTEFLPGRSLAGWVVNNSEVIVTSAGAEDLTAYYLRCGRVLDAVEEALKRLHATGHVFVDVSPGNLVIDDDDTVRLIDFEGVHRIGTPITPITTRGYAPPAGLADDDPTVYDDYGTCALALLMLLPMHEVVQRHPGALDHLAADLRTRAPLPVPLWDRVTRYHPPAPAPEAAWEPPAAEELAADPLPHLAVLRDHVADALLAMAEPDHPDRVFPTVAEGYTANSLCVAYGTAGVVHALHKAGRAVPEGVLERLRSDALAEAGDLPPGLHFGLAGIAWVLADQGLLTEATDLLARATEHPLTGSCATLAGGAAGVALTHLALHRHTGDARHLDRARELTGALLGLPDLTPRLGDDDATGLLHGRAGIALLLQQLAEVTGEQALLDSGVGLLHAELDRDLSPDAPTLDFPLSRVDQRVLPYLFCGSAGFTHVASRYLPHTGDERLNRAMSRLLPRMTTRFAAMPGLYQGISGLALVLSEHARLTGAAPAREAALDTATGLFKHAVPHPTGARFLGDQMLRYSAELWSGSAGLLLSLNQLTKPVPDPFFTVDAPTVPTGVPSPRTTASGS
ncbi:class III lanthionine synthetase LanKC [Streptomyces sp. TP-A0874]|uniref:class III lanthionine synthetase LanKC n=1 Tax=Streptomyces sp. TP-A0874 TaxID=549819 RepID=UPI000852BEC6|nr:class III lanthionine synthetase LanKC [Streptomyces sp. TP-A0874]